MKHVLLTISLLLAFMVAQAAPITTEKAKENAMAFLSSGNMQRVRGNRTLSLAYTRNDAKGLKAPLFHVFNIGEGNGFVIASADDVAVPVLGYCDSGGFDPDNIPENMREWLDGYAAQISQVQENPEAFSRSNSSSSNSANKKSIDALVVTHWSQAAPFNDQCIFDGHRCLTGCVATAMAQILYYWASTGKDGVTFRPGCTALEGYDRSYHIPALDALESFDWDVMHPLRESSFFSVAQLMRYCGQSLKMRYGINISTANEHYVPTALHENFGYNFTIDDVYASSYTTAEWEDLIYNELSKGQPVMMHGGDHCFICDGYDAGSGQFHFNWGWGGGADGWFAMTALNPGNYNFNSGLFALININPLAPREPFPYAILSEDETTLTFYHDSQYELCDGRTCRIQGSSPGWIGLTEYPDDNPITDVVFDPSFASARPQSTSSWFDMWNLSSITGLQYLNTERVTDMYAMFRDCPLYEIDLSHFDTSKVRDMSEMFECSSILHLDMSSWNTSNVESMIMMFNECSSLQDIVLPSNLPKIDDGMFYECKSLRNVFIPESVQSIENGAFSESGLKSVSIPSQVGKIGEYAFNTCNALTTVVVKRPEPLPITENTFSNYAGATLYVPKGSRSAYMAAENWKLFGKIVELSGFKGDVNNDGQVSITDVTFLVNYVLGNHHDGFVIGIADVNDDGQVTITDVTTIVNIILNNTPAPQAYLTCPDDHHPHLIDLGLPSGTKWACCNVGATTPEGYGGHYAWGETEEKSTYDWSSYIYCDGTP